MGRDLVANFILRLQDRTGAGLVALQRRLQQIAGLARRFAVVGAVTAGLSFAGPIQSAAAFETRLRDVAIAAGVMSNEMPAAIARMRGELETLAAQNRLTSSGLLSAVEVLTARGLGADEVRAYTRTIAQLAGASGAAEADLANLSVALNRIAGITSEMGQRQALAQAFRAGQLGGVELRDMAQYLPTVLAGMSSLGVTGPRAIQNASSLLQVTRDSFGSVSEASAAVRQLIGQLFSEGTQRNARELLGRDLAAIFQRAQSALAAGRDVDPVEALFGALRRGLAGREQLIFQVIPDENARNAFIAWNAQVGRYLDLRRQLRGTEFNAVEDALSLRTVGLGAEWRLFTQRMTQLSNRLGDAVGANLLIINSLLERFVGWIEQMDVAFPGAINTALGFGGAAIGIATALGAIGLVLGPLAVGFKALMSPVGLAVVALVAGAIHITRHWERFRQFFQQMGDGLTGIVRGFVENITGLLTGDFARGAEGTMQVWRGVQSFFEGLWGTVRTLFTDFSGWVDGWSGGAVTEAVGRVRDAFSGLTAWFEGLWNGIRAPFDTFISGVLSAIERIRAMLPSLTPAMAAGPPALGRMQDRQREALANIGGGFYPPSGPGLDGRVTVEVRPAPGAEVVQAESDNRQVSVTTAPPNRGAMRQRP